MADAAETVVPEQEVVLEAVEKKEELKKTTGEEEVNGLKVEEPAPEGLKELSGDKAIEVVEGESKPEDALPAAEIASEAASEVVLETVPEAKPEAEVDVSEVKPQVEAVPVEAAVEMVLEAKQEVEPKKEEVKEVEAENKQEEESTGLATEAVPKEPVKEDSPAKVPAMSSTKIEIPSVVEYVPEKAVVEEPLEDKKEEGQETITMAAAEEAIPEEVIEDKAVVEEVVKEEKPVETDAKAAVTEAEATPAGKQGEKQSGNMISKMKRSLSKVKKAFVGKSPTAK